MGGTPIKIDKGACQKIQIKPLRETNVGVAERIKKRINFGQQGWVAQSWVKVSQGNECEIWTQIWKLKNMEIYLNSFFLQYDDWVILKE